MDGQFFARVAYDRQACHAFQLAMCVPLVFLVILKTVRKSKYSISKTIIWAQSWICVEMQDFDLICLRIFKKMQDFDLHIFEIISEIHDLDLHIFRYFKHQGFDLQFFENISKIQDLDLHILRLFQKSRIWISSV